MGRYFVGNLKIDKRIKERLIFYRDTGINVKRIWVGGLDARENFVVGGGGNHGAIVAAKFRLWENGICQSGTKGLISTDSASEDDSLNLWMLGAGFF